MCPEAGRLRAGWPQGHERLERRVLAGLLQPLVLLVDLASLGGHSTSPQPPPLWSLGLLVLNFPLFIRTLATGFRARPNPVEPCLPYIHTDLISKYEHITGAGARIIFAGAGGGGSVQTL